MTGRQKERGVTRVKGLPGADLLLMSVTPAANRHGPAGRHPVAPLFDALFSKATKKDGRTAVLFCDLPSTGYCRQKRKKKKKREKNKKPDQHRPGSAFFRGTISSGNIATGSHPSSSIVKRVWEGWGELEGGREPFVRQPKGSLPPSKNIHSAAYPRASSAHRARRAASCSAFLQLLPLAVNCCPEGRETCTVKCRACSGPSQARVV